FEDELADVARQHELGVVSYFSLASGFLTGKYKTVEDLEGSARADFLKKYFDERGQKVLQTLLEVSDGLSAKPEQVALAWLLGRPGLTAPIVSATSLAQLDEVLDAAALVLPEDALARLQAASN